MRPPALLDLLARLLREHDHRGPGSGLAVVPVVLAGDLDEIDDADPPLQRLLAATAHYADATFLDAGTVAAAAPASLADHVALRAALTAALTIERPYGTQALTFDDGDVRLGGTDVNVASDGERELIGLARSLLDQRWTRVPLGLLTYSERNMDKPSLRAAWDAVTAALATPIGLGELRTLVVLVRAPRLHYDVHLSSERSAHYVLDSQRLVARRTDAHGRTMAAELARGTNPFVLHLGAGFSISSNLPLGNDLRDDALRRRYDESHDADIRTLAIRLFRDGQRDGRLTAREAEAGESSFADSLTLEQVVRLESTMYSGTPRTLEDFAERHTRAIPGTAVRALRRIVGARPGLVLVTVNFDELIEQHVGERVRRFATDAEIDGFPTYLEDYIAGREAAVPLLKLHGTISDPESCVVSEEQTEAGLPAHKRRALQAIARLGSNAPIAWTYVGASLRDVDVVPVLDDDLFRNNTEESWVAPLRDASIDDFAARYRARVWRQAGNRPDLEERTISASADWFLERLAEHVDQQP